MTEGFQPARKRAPLDIELLISSPIINDQIFKEAKEAMMLIQSTF